MTFSLIYEWTALRNLSAQLITYTRKKAIEHNFFSNEKEALKIILLRICCLFFLSIKLLLQGSEKNLNPRKTKTVKAKKN